MLIEPVTDYASHMVGNNVVLTADLVLGLQMACVLCAYIYDQCI